MKSQRLSSCFHIGRIGALLAAVPLVLAAAVWFSRNSDDAMLQQQADAVTAGLTSASAKIRAVNNWAYHNQGFGKNHRFFVVPALGPTPVQVMESGGDCSDKSRLVSAMLHRLGIDSGLVMIAPCPRCGFIHTVVEARYDGGRMVVDPIWNVDYPAADGRFLGARALAGTTLGPEHVAELQQQSPPGAKIRQMPAAEATFDDAVAVNWNKYFVTRAIAYGLGRLGYDPQGWLRPRILEDPKLAITVVLLGVAGGLVVAGMAIGFAFPALDKRFRRSRYRELLRRA